MIPFNKPFLSGSETDYIIDAVNTGHISGNGIYTKKCHTFFENRYGFKKTLLTTSCTDALEMCAMLLNVEPEDEIIIPSYTFVSTALAFIRQGAKIIFADSSFQSPNIDADKIESLITRRTKAIVVVHYAGFACDMVKIMEIAHRYNLFVVEDAAQAIDSYLNKTPLGTFGHLAVLSFHETKNIQCGEGGLLIINDEQFIKRSEILWEKGTNRADFFRGQINKYGWVDTGSSFLPSELNAAFLFAQLENIDFIQKCRIEIWEKYFDGLLKLHETHKIELKFSSKESKTNGHMFYFLCTSLHERTELIDFLKERNILSVFHYQSLHKSNFYTLKHDGRELPNSDNYSDRLVRLPLYVGLTQIQQISIIDTIHQFYNE